MSERMISRRVALKLLGLAPVAAGAAFARRAGAEPAGPSLSILHDPGLSTVLDQAKAYSETWHGNAWWNDTATNGHGNETNGQKYARVAAALWVAFQTGIFSHDDTMAPEPDLLGKLFATHEGPNQTQQTWTGKALVHNLMHFDDHDPDDGSPGKTYAHLMVCALRCGSEAAKLEPTKLVGIDSYNRAWQTVSTNTFATLQKIDPTITKKTFGDVSLMDGGC